MVSASKSAPLEEDDSVMLNQLDNTGLPCVMQGIDLEKVKLFATGGKMM